LVGGFLSNFGIANKPGPYRGADIVLPDGRTIEVKMRRRTFTCPKDYPDKEAIIDSKQCWDKKEPKPLAYIIVSHDTGKMVCTRGFTPEKWKEKSVPNNRNGKHVCYVIEKKYLRPIESLVDFLRAKS